MTLLQYSFRCKNVNELKGEGRKRKKGKGRKRKGEAGCGHCLVEAAAACYGY
jgi:hypothetical protein